MKQKNFNSIAGFIFLIVAVLHLSRLIYGWEVIFGENNMPIWVSWFGFIVGALLAYQGFTLFRKS